MFVVVPFVLYSGLLSILTVLVLSSFYGIELIVLAQMIRNVRQETSRDSLRDFLRLVIADHFLAAFITLGCSVALVVNPSLHRLIPLITSLAAADDTVVISLAVVLGALAVGWVLVGVVLMLISEDLAPRVSIHRQLRWHGWTTVLIVLGLLMNLGTMGVFLVMSAPLFWHLIHVNRMSRQSTLVWTLAIAVRQQLPLGPEILSASEGFWGRQRFRLQLLSENLDAGSSLATSLERQPGLVPRSIVMMIRMGEETNMLGPALENCALSYTRRNERESDMITAQQAFMLLLIPLLMIPNVLGFLCYYIVPKFKKIFEDFGTELPALTQGVVGFMQPSSGAFFLMFMLSAAGVGLVLFINLRDWEKDWPLLNWLTPRINGPPILRGLALLIREKRSLPAGVQGLMWSHPRASVRVRLSRLYQLLHHGGDLATGLAAERLIRRGDIPFLRAAERVQNLPWSLEQLAESMEGKFWYRLRLLLEVGYPLAVIAIGIVVMLITAGFFLPLIKLLNDLS